MLKIVPFATRSKRWAICYDVVWHPEASTHNADVLQMIAARKVVREWLTAHYEELVDYRWKKTVRWNNQAHSFSNGNLVYFKSHVEATAFKLRWG